VNKEYVPIVYYKTKLLTVLRRRV